jgi:hypothetical protein
MEVGLRATGQPDRKIVPHGGRNAGGMPSPRRPDQGEDARRQQGGGYCSKDREDVHLPIVVSTTKDRGGTL